MRATKFCLVFIKPLALARNVCDMIADAQSVVANCIVSVWSQRSTSIKREVEAYNAVNSVTLGTV